MIDIYEKSYYINALEFYKADVILIFDLLVRYPLVSYDVNIPIHNMYLPI